MAYVIVSFLGGAIAGALCGAIPMIIGNQKHQENLGWAGFVVCVFSGLIMGLLLAAPVAGLFTWRIYALDKIKSSK